MRSARKVTYSGICRPLIPDFFEGACGEHIRQRCSTETIKLNKGSPRSELRLIASMEGVGSDALRALEELSSRLRGEEAVELLRAIRLTLLKFSPRERRCLAGEQRLLGYVEDLMRAGAGPKEAARSLLGEAKLVVVRPNGRLYIGRPLLRAWRVEGEYVKVRVQGRTAITRVGGKGVVLHSLRPGLTPLEIKGLDKPALVSEICRSHGWAVVDGNSLLIRVGSVTWRIPIERVAVGTSCRTAGSGVMRADAPLSDVTVRLLSNGRAYVRAKHTSNLEVLVGFRELGDGLIELVTRRYVIRGRVADEGILLSGLGFYYYVGPERAVYLSPEILLGLREKGKSAVSKLGRAGELIVRELGLDPSFPIFSGLRAKVARWIDPKVWHELYEGHNRPDLFAEFASIGDSGPVDVKSTIRGMRGLKNSDLMLYKAQVREYMRHVNAQRGLIVALIFNRSSGRLENVRLYDVRL